MTCNRMRLFLADILLDSATTRRGGGCRDNLSVCSLYHNMENVSILIFVNLVFVKKWLIFPLGVF